MRSGKRYFLMQNHTKITHIALYILRVFNILFFFFLSSFNPPLVFTIYFHFPFLLLLLLLISYLLIFFLLSSSSHYHHKNYRHLIMIFTGIAANMNKTIPFHTLSKFPALLQFDLIKVSCL